MKESFGDWHWRQAHILIDYGALDLTCRQIRDSLVDRVDS